MSKQIKVSDELHQGLKAAADHGHRSIVAQIELEHLHFTGDMVAKSVVSEPQASPPPVSSTPKYTSVDQTNRKSKPVLLEEIKAREALRDEDLEYSQDPDTNREIIKTAKADLDALWVEYNAL